MEYITLNAIKRDKKSGKFNESGFIAGVIYGDTFKEAVSVKFEELALKRVLAKHGSNAKVWIKLGDMKKFGFIKEIQRHPVSNKITHVDIQLVSKDHYIKMQIPINFSGVESLNKKLLQLQINKAELEVSGKMDLMPEVIHVDVSEKQLGDTITVKDFGLDNEIKAMDKEDEVFGVITHFEQQSSDTDDEADQSAEK